MKTELKVKFLQQLINKKREEKGFTLIELLVVIIIIGILSAIALPSFLNQSAKARASEARTNLGAINRSQQAYYLENQKFIEDGGTPGTAIGTLGIGIKDTANYKYEVTTVGGVATDIINRAKSQNKDLKGHVGGVFSTGGQTPSVLCEALTAADENTGTPVAANPALDSNNEAKCDTASSKQVGG